MYQSIYLSIYLSDYLSIYLSIDLSIYLHIFITFICISHRPIFGFYFLSTGLTSTSMFSSPSQKSLIFSLLVGLPYTFFSAIFPYFSLSSVILIVCFFPYQFFNLSLSLSHSFPLPSSFFFLSKECGIHLH